MKRSAGVCLAVALASSHALGGTIGFDPEKVTIDPAVDSPLVDFVLSVGTLAFPGGSTSLNAFDFVVGSNDGPDLINFVIEPGLTPAFPIFTVDHGKYAEDLKFGAFIIPFITTGAPLGTLTVNTTGLPLGTYHIVVDSAIDGGQSRYTNGLDVDLITTSVAQINIVPEPGTLSLLGVGVLFLIRRRGRVRKAEERRVR